MSCRSLDAFSISPRSLRQLASAYRPTRLLELEPVIRQLVVPDSLRAGPILSSVEKRTFVLTPCTEGSSLPAETEPCERQTPSGDALRTLASGPPRKRTPSGTMTAARPRLS